MLRDPGQNIHFHRGERAFLRETLLCLSKGNVAQKTGSCKQWTYYGAGICISSQCTAWADEQRQALLQQQGGQEDTARLRQAAEEKTGDGHILTKEQDPAAPEHKEAEDPEKGKEAGGQDGQPPGAQVQAAA